MTTLLEQAEALFSVKLTPEQGAQFDTYAAELAAWNEKINLTAITAPGAVRVRHFLDSLSVAQAAGMTDGLRVVDIGTGAGFPGLALAIAFPQVQVALMEATGKKVGFLDHMIQTLNLDNARTLNARAEDAGHLPDHRAKYDLVLARAVARMPALLEYMLPLATLHGRCIAMKGETAEEEAHDAAAALKVLGGTLTDIVTVNLPEVEQPHYLVVVQKTAPTPDAYPRKPGVPTRQPLS